MAKKDLGKKVYENFQELDPEKKDLVGYHSKSQEEKKKNNSPIFLDPEKYKITKEDRAEWAKHKEKERASLGELSEEEVLKLDSLGEQGVKKYLDKLIEDAPPSNNIEHKDWEHIGHVLDYVNNKKYDWLIDYQLKAYRKNSGSE